VFPADFDLDAVEAVCVDHELAEDSVFELVARLVEKSVVVREHGAGGVRYRLLDTLREYGREWLDALGGRPELQRRHRDHYLRVAQGAAAAWFGPNQADTIVRTERERANFRAALEYCLATPGEAEQGLRLGATLWFCWASYGHHLGEGRRWLDRSLALAPEPTPARVEALGVTGRMATLQGDVTAADELLVECRELATRSGDPRALAYALHHLGLLAMVQNDHPRAVSLYTDAVARLDALGELNSRVMLAHCGLALASAFVGDLDRADAVSREARATCERHGEQYARAHAIYVQAYVARLRQEVSAATALAREALRHAQALHYLTIIVLNVELLASLAAAASLHSRAAVLRGAAMPMWSALGLRAFGSRSFTAPHDEAAARARRALGDEAYEAAYRRGTELELYEAVAYALGEWSSGLP
jgi:hypothetical protein